LLRIVLKLLARGILRRVLGAVPARPEVVEEEEEDGE
jgi:hypothetical protein